MTVVGRIQREMWTVILRDGPLMSDLKTLVLRYTVLLEQCGDAWRLSNEDGDV